MFGLKKEVGEVSEDSFRQECHRIKKIRKNIRYCDDKKKSITDKLLEFELRLSENRITYSEYEFLRNNYLGKRTEQEWYQYYDDYKGRAEYFLSEYRPVREEKKYEAPIKSNYRILIPIIFVLLALPALYFLTTYTGFSTVDIVEFEYNSSWQNAFLRISQGDYHNDIPISELLINNTIVFDASSLNLTGEVYVDLIADDTLIDSRKINILEPINETNISLPTENITDVNLTIKPNLTDITLPIENITEINLTNITETPELNLTNATNQLNLTLTNETVKNLTKKEKKYKIKSKIKNKDISVVINGLSEDVLLQSSNIDSVEYSGKQITMVTDVIAVNESNIDNATITMPKSGNINKIMKCKDWDFANTQCNGSWEVTNIPFMQNDSYVWFTVSSFSGYGGSNITIIDLVAYPKSGDIWTVRFNTTGKANLTITPVNNTNWTEFLTDNSLTDNDEISFESLKCGNTTLNNSILVDDGTNLREFNSIAENESIIVNKIIIPDYECNETAAISNLVHIPGYATLMFEFGNDIGYAIDPPGTAVTACGTISAAGIYNLTVDIIESASARCIIITSSNVIFDGQGHRIDSNGAGTEGIYVNGASKLTNVTIMNAVVSDWATRNVYFLTVGNSTVNNVSTFWTDGIILDFSTNITISNNNLTGTDNALYGIRIYESSNNSIINNTAVHFTSSGIRLELDTAGSNNNIIKFNNASKNGEYGLHIINSNTNTVEHNYFNANAGASHYGIYVTATSPNNVFNNNTMISNGAHGIQIEAAASNIIANSTIGKNGGSGISTASTATLLRIEGNKVYSNTASGIILLSTLTKIIGNTITSHTATVASSSGIFLNGDAVDLNYIYNNTINSNRFGILVTNGDNNLLRNNTIINSTAWAFRSQTTSVNTSAYGTNLGPFTLNYFRADNMAIINASSPAAAPTGNTSIGIFINVTNVTTTMGLVSASSKFKMNISYTAADIGGYPENSLTIGRYNGTWETVPSKFATQYGSSLTEDYVSVNLSSAAAAYTKMAIYTIFSNTTAVDLTQISTCTTISAAGNYDLTTSITDSTAGTCINITVSNVLFNGNSFTIDGTSAGTGIVVNSTSTLANVTIRNLVLSDWTSGLKYISAQNATLENISIFSGNSGISLTNSNNITINNNNFSTISGASPIILANSSFNLIVNNTITSNAGGGMTLRTYSNRNLVTNNNISENGALDGGDGLDITNSIYNNITNNTIYHDLFYGILIDSSNNTLIANNTISNSGMQGIRFDSATDNTVKNNSINNNTNGGIYLSASSNNTFINNSIKGTATYWDFISLSESVNNTFYNLNLGPIISFTGKDIGIWNASYPPADPAGFTNIGKYVNATNNSADSWLYLNISYTNSDLGSLNENNLIIARHNGSWETTTSTFASPSGVDTGNNYVYANITKFSTFAPMGSSGNSVPTQSTPILNSTFGTNTPTENLTVYNQSTADADNDRVTNIINWYRDGSSIIALNMPMERNGNNLTHVTDYSGNGNNGTNYSAVFNATAGYDGTGAYQFNAAGSGIQIPFSNSLNLSNSVSVSVWIYPISNRSAGSINPIIESISGEPIVNRLYLTSGNVLQAQFWISNGYNDNWGSSEISLNSWSYIVYTFDSSTQKLYVNGALVGSNSQTGILVTGTEKIKIGYSETNANIFNGTIDELKVYNSAISAEQVQALYLNQTNKIVQQETNTNEIWQACITPNDGLVDGTTSCSNNLTILNSAPTHGTPILNSTLGINKSDENLTVYNQSTADVDNDRVTNIINWYRNGSSIAVLNMPFDTNYSNHSFARIIKDYSSYGNNGTGGSNDSSKTPQWRNYGISGGSYKFDGSNDFIKIPASSALDVQRLTIEAWVNSSNFNQNGFIFEKTTNGVVNTQYSCFFNTDASIYFRTFNTGPTSDDLVTTLVAAGINNNQWNHIACVYNGTAKALFVNGILKNMKAYTETLQTNPAGTSIIGAYGSGEDYRFNGAIDEVRVYNISLTPQQIAADYNAGAAKYNLIEATMTDQGETWQACLTPNDGLVDGITKCSNNLTILSIPTQGTPILNSTLGTNRSNENLTVYNISTADADNDRVTNIINWYRNGSSIAVLNMPFDINYSDHTLTNIIKDYSGYGSNGTAIGGITYNSTGGYGRTGSYNFGTAGQYINVTGNSLNIAGNQLTLEAWIYHTAAPDNDGIIFKGPLSNSQGVYSLIYASNIYFRLNGAAVEGSGQVSTINGPFANNKWHHIVATYDGVNQKIYLDGELNATALYSSSINANTDSLKIGTYYSTSFPFSGLIDNVKVYNKSLSAEQVQALYKNRTDLIVQQETARNEVWQACITPNDGLYDGTTSCSNNLTVLNAIPTQGTPILNSSSGTDLTEENLTVYNQSTADADNDAVTNIINWYKNGTSIMVLNMPMERNSNNLTHVMDYSPFGNNGTNYSATFNATAGYGGKGAYQFNAAGNGIQIPFSNSLNLSNSVSVSVWIYPISNRSAGSINPIIESISGEPIVNRLYLTSGNVLQAQFWISNGYNDNWGSSEISLNSWSYIVYTFDSSTQKLYVNGALVGSNSQTGILVTGTENIKIGYSQTNANTFNGTIDEVRIYNSSLSAEQIQALYKNRTDLIVQQETNANEIWQACITPNDAYEDGITTCSNNLTIVAATQPVSTCTNITQPGNYILTQSITNSAVTTCINILSSNVTFDGQGYGVDGLTTADTVGIFVNGATALTNVNVKNVVVSDWGRNIQFITVSNSTVNNVSAYYGDGIVLDFSKGNNITNNNLTGTLAGAYGISLWDSSNNTVENNSAYYFTSSGIRAVYDASGSNYNVIRYNNASNNLDEGIRLLDVNNNIVEHNYFNGNGGGNGYGIYVTAASFNNNNILNNNTIIGNLVHGIQAEGGVSNKIVNNTIRNNLGNGISTAADELTLIIEGNNISSNSQNGMAIITAGTQTKIINNTITSHTSTTANQGNGIFINGDTVDDTFIVNNTIDSNRYGIKITNGDNNLLRNNTITNSVVWAFISQTTAVNTTAYNTNLGPFTLNYFMAQDMAIKNASSPAADPTGNNSIGIFLNVTNQSTTSGTVASSSKFKMNITYTAADIGAYPENSLTIGRHNGTWETRPNVFALPYGSSLSDDYVYANLTSGAPFSKGIFTIFSNATAANPNQISTCTNITLPGVYTLTQSITNSDYATCINITTSNVVIDGQGFTIDGADTASTEGINVQNATLTNITIKNIIMTDWANGVYLEGVNRSVLQNINSSSNTQRGVYFSLAGYNNLSNLTLRRNGIYGLYIQASSSYNTIENSDMSYNLNDGIRLYSSSNYNNITNNTVNSNTDYGIIMIENNYNNITNNIANSNQVGIYFNTNEDNGIITGNNASFNSNTGIYLGGGSDRNIVSNNTANRNNLGIIFWAGGESYNNITDNIMNSNAFGFYSNLGNHNLFRNNTANNNTDTGFYLTGATNNVLVNNTARNNSNYGIELITNSNYNNLSGNIVTNNLDTGILIYSGSNSNTVFNNTVTSNPQGIYIYAGYYNNLTDNTVTSNPTYGILFVSAIENIVKNNRVASNYRGFWLSSSINNSFIGNLVTSSTVDGFLVSGTNTNNFTENIVTGSGNVGIYFQSSSNGNQAINNTLTSNLYGLYILQSSNNTITNNTANSNTYGIVVDKSANNTLINNSANSNTLRGFWLAGPTNSTILTNNTAQGNTYFDFISDTNSINNKVTGLNIGPIISFIGKDVGIKNASSPAADPSGYQNIGKYVNATNQSADSWLHLNVSYYDYELNGRKESSLIIGRHNGSWETTTSAFASPSGVDTTNNYVFANISNFSTGRIYAPLINKFQIDSCANITEPGIYTLTQSITSSLASVCINITTSNAFFDGNGYTIDGIDTVTAMGISASNSTSSLVNITLKNSVVTDWGRGINYGIVNNSVINNNTATSNEINIYTTASHNNTISNNTVSGSNYGIYLSASDNNTVINNSASGLTYGLLLYVGSDYNTIVNNTANSNSAGIFISWSNYYNMITNNSFNSNSWGIWLQIGSHYNTFRNNTLYGNTNGILVDNSNNNTFTNNLITASSTGYDFRINTSSYDNTITNLMLGSKSLSFKGSDFELYNTSTRPADPNNYQNISLYVNVTNTSTINSWIFLNLSYKDSDLGNVYENSLFIGRNNGSWNTVTSTFASPSGVITGQNYVFANITNFGNKAAGIFAALGTPTAIPNCRNISEPGVYYLTQSITNSNYATCINITTSNVVIDGQGFTIDGADTASTEGIAAHNATLTNITLKNLIMTDWEKGVYFESVNRSVIKDINSSSNTQRGIYLFSSSSYNNLSNLTLMRNGDYGLYIQTSNTYNTIQNSDISYNLDEGFRLQTSNTYNIITNNTVNSNTNWGIMLIENNHNNITDNTANSNQVGIYLNTNEDDNIVTGNNASFNSNTGIYLAGGSDRNLVSNNTANRNNLGIIFWAGGESYNNITDNIMNSNAFGFYSNAGNHNLFRNNTAINNTDTGFYLTGATNNVLVNNTARNNSNYGIELITNSNYNNISNNIVLSNSHGIYVQASHYNLFENNNASLNTNNGFMIYSASKNNTLNNNTANSNSNVGIYLHTNANNNTVTNNNLNSNYYGFYVLMSKNNTVTNNSAKSNSFGFASESSNDNYFFNNTANSNTQYGFWFQTSSNSSTLVNNTAQGNSRWEYISQTNSFDNRVTGLSIGPIISFNSKDVALNNASSPAADPVGFTNISKYVNVTNQSADSWIYLNISYTASEAASLTESNLGIARHNGSWETNANLFGSPNGVDQVNNYVFANISNFTTGRIYAPLYNDNFAPTQSTPILNSTLGTNRSNENLTVYNISTADIDNDKVTNIINWYRNGSSITVLNLPFDTNYSNHSVANIIRDYSGYGNNGTGGGQDAAKTPVWRNYGISGGSYKFNGIDDFIKIPASSALDTQRLTIEAWVNSSDFNQLGFIFEKTTNGVVNTQYACFFDTTPQIIFRTFNTNPTSHDLTTTLVAAGINNNQWNHIACVYNGTAKALFVNGVLKNMTAYTETLQTNPAGTSIIGAYGSGDGYFFNGAIDELHVYNISLTPQQIAANYNAGNAKYNVIDSSMTNYGENWNASITPNDGYEDGDTLFSNNLTINYPPDKVTLAQPLHGNRTIVNRTVTFSWLSTTDGDGDAITYNLSVKCYSTLGGSCSPSDDRAASGITSTNYVIPSELIYLRDDNYYYNWTITPYDNKDFGEDSNQSNFSIISTIILNLSVDKINFGDLNINDNDSTTSNSPMPFTLDNLGNVKVNVNMSGTRLFSSGSFPSDNFMFRIRSRPAYPGSFNSSSNTSFANVPAVTGAVIYSFNYTNATNSAYIDINLTVPNDEPSGVKSSILTFIGKYIG